MTTARRRPAVFSVFSGLFYPQMIKKRLKQAKNRPFCKNVVGETV
jgi:hypothetical protein